MAVSHRFFPSLAPASAAAALALGALPISAGADTLLSGNHSIDGRVCTGTACQATETYPHDVDLKIKEHDPRLLFEDSSTEYISNSSRDWMLVANEFAGPAEYFAIKDLESGREVFRVDADIRPNAIHAGFHGLGLGTSFPTTDLHIVDGSAPGITLEQDGSAGLPPASWSLAGSNAGFYINSPASPAAFYIHSTTEGTTLLTADNSVAIAGHGTSPAATLAVGSPIPGDGPGNTQILVQETNGTQTARPLLNMVNYGRPDIIMANTATGGEWAFGAGTNFVLKNGAVGSSDGDKDLQLKLYGATGNLEITGQIITGGPTCAGGCDAVFSEGYNLPSISEHAAEMFALGHLPNVGPTAPGQPVNMSEQYGKLLNELEHAHIYIAEQNARISKLEALGRSQRAEIAALKNGQAALEARLDALK